MSSFSLSFGQRESLAQALLSGHNLSAEQSLSTEQKQSILDYALYLAVRQEEEKVLTLLDKGANPKAYPCLAYAVVEKNEKLSALLLQHGAVLPEQIRQDVLKYGPQSLAILLSKDS